MGSDAAAARPRSPARSAGELRQVVGQDPPPDPLCEAQFAVVAAPPQPTTAPAGGLRPFEIGPTMTTSRHSHLSLGLITCYRPGLDVRASVSALRRGGFDGPLHLFCEPGTPDVAPVRDVITHRNPTRLGVLGNWRHCLAWLLEHAAAEYLLVCEDDVAYCPGARDAWARSLSRVGPVGFWSLYTPRRDRDLMGGSRGWVAANRGRDAWGTQAMIFPRASAELVLRYPPLREEDQMRGPTDAIVAQCFLEAGIPCYYHSPSLADHLGRVSSVGHNWQEEHVGLDFDPNYRPPADERGSPPPAPETTPRPAAARRPRAAVVTVYQDNIPAKVVARQAEVVCRFLPEGCAFEPRRVGHHALGLDDYFRDLRHDAYLVLDIDCIPIAGWVIPWMLENACAGTLVGAAQRANHLDNGGHLYAGPCALAFSRDTFERAGRPSFRDTPRGDVGEELTYACERLGIPVALLWPTQVDVPRWTLLPGVPFGLGTTFGGAVYHAFEIAKGHTAAMFLAECERVLGAESVRAGPAFATPAPVPAVDARPVFHESWYADGELALLRAAVQFVLPLAGAIVEIGCWEGRSTAAIAEACRPEPVLAVDTWLGNLAEGPAHETVRLARQRDVFARFAENMRLLGAGNVTPTRMEALDFLRRDSAPIKFCHLDASHDYASVREALTALLPRLVPGAVLFGHDYESAHAGRDDLQGGVQRAVREVLPRHLAAGNTWRYIHVP